MFGVCKGDMWRKHREPLLSDFSLNISPDVVYKKIHLLTLQLQENQDLSSNP